MIVYPNPYIFKELKGEYVFGKCATLSISKKYAHSSEIKLFVELWKNFTGSIGEIELNIIENCENNLIISSNRSFLKKENIKEYEYSINCSENGISLSFNNVKAMAHGLCTILQLLEVRETKLSKEKFAVAFCNIFDKPLIAFRGVHICVFSGMELHFLRRLVRFLGFLKYSHIVIEFWGMLKLDALEELAWKDKAFTKEQVKPIIEEAKALGMEVIPMFNHLGHASLSRAAFGRHVILDQNPALAPLFEPNGWTWNIKNPDTLILLKNIREELIDFFGNGEYFHIGCDEAESFGMGHLYYGERKNEILINYLNTVINELDKKGRRPIMWGDDLLNSADWEKPYIANGRIDKDFNTKELIEKLSKKVIIDDWQYGQIDTEIETSKCLSSQGLDVIISPWDNVQGIKSSVETVPKNNLKGIIQTTWHHININYLLSSSVFMWCGIEKMPNSIMKNNMLFAAAGGFSRKLLPSKDYMLCGWSKEEVVL